MKTFYEIMDTIRSEIIDSFPRASIRFVEDDDGFFIVCEDQPTFDSPAFKVLVAKLTTEYIVANFLSSVFFVYMPPFYASEQVSRPVVFVGFSVKPSLPNNTIAFTSTDAYSYRGNVGDYRLLRGAA